MTDELDRIEALAAAAAAGPWEVDEDYRRVFGFPTVRCARGGRPTILHVSAHLREMDESAAFVAAARAAVPALVAEVRRLRAAEADAGRLKDALRAVRSLAVSGLDREDGLADLEEMVRVVNGVLGDAP